MAGRVRWLLWLLLQQFGPILLIVNQAGSSPADKTIRIGYLASYMQNTGAMNIAIERAQNDGLLPGYNFRYIAYGLVFIIVLNRYSEWLLANFLLLLKHLVAKM